MIYTYFNRTLNTILILLYAIFYGVAYKYILSVITNRIVIRSRLKLMNLIYDGYSLQMIKWYMVRFDAYCKSCKLRYRNSSQK